MKESALGLEVGVGSNSLDSGDIFFQQGKKLMRIEPVSSLQAASTADEVFIFIVRVPLSTNRSLLTIDIELGYVEIKSCTKKQSFSPCESTSGDY
jgi:hypothetical protein